MRIIVLTDYRNQYWLHPKHKEASLDVNIIISYFRELGWNATIMQFSEVNFLNQQIKGTYFIYQSSEDPNLYYKSYIEDILLGIHLVGGILIPDIYCFRAHHNKVFMEILRCILLNDEIENLKSRWFGTYEEYRTNLDYMKQKHFVFKTSSGAKSSGVRLLVNNYDKHKIPKRYSNTIDIYYWFVNIIKPLLRNKYPEYRAKSNNRKKFVIQEYIPNLKGDYKVVIMWERYYVLWRGIRKNDFRASGSGRFEWQYELPEGLLDYAKYIFNILEVPFISLDIAYNGNKYILIEFQFVSFGLYTVDRADYYFKCNNELWVKESSKEELELIFSKSVDNYIKYIKSKNNNTEN